MSNFLFVGVCYIAAAQSRARPSLSLSTHKNMGINHEKLFGRGEEEEEEVNMCFLTRQGTDK